MHVRHYLLLLWVNYRGIANNVVAMCRYHNGELWMHFISSQIDASPAVYRCFGTVCVWLARFDHWLRNRDVAAHHSWVFSKRRDLCFYNPEIQIVFVVYFHCGVREDWGTLCSPFPWKEMGKYIVVVLCSAHSSLQHFHTKSNATRRRLLNDERPPSCCSLCL